ncbi:MarR family winged helix-turn-helix transcriptional regulator [Amycolatopsis sp. H20-H5]|uniref:MarR family winged helix-turn-helix transcriptional regulator n=1 Tax=Amycolatopsis sp. H20-H5 TaxID=3046309 RepID=UPI002DB961D1|nr:MarR family transcriptional regulator [Amycolatopsis sp. H20-H5]MEC3977842.1 MarR family transcriptional regulator [Amycolatopsis sp. H20-H5]
MSPDRAVRDRHDFLAGIERELTLLGRHQVLPGSTREPGVLEKSAYLLLTRLEAQQPMSLRELADAFRLDVSTVNRQVAALLRQGLAERIPDPDGGLARKLRPTAEGARKLREDREHYRRRLGLVVTGWSEADRHAFYELLLRFNSGIEVLQGTHWPR